MRKAICMLLALCLVLSLTACGKSENTAQTEAAKDTAIVDQNENEVPAETPLIVDQDDQNDPAENMEESGGNKNSEKQDIPDGERLVIQHEYSPKWKAHLVLTDTRLDILPDYWEDLEVYATFTLYNEGDTIVDLQSLIYDMSLTLSDENGTAVQEEMFFANIYPRYLEPGKTGYMYIEVDPDESWQENTKLTAKLNMEDEYNAEIIDKLDYWITPLPALLSWDSDNNELVLSVINTTDEEVTAHAAIMVTEKESGRFEIANTDIYKIPADDMDEERWHMEVDEETFYSILDVEVFAYCE